MDPREILMQNEHTFMKKLHKNIVTGIKTFPELTYKYTAKKKHLYRRRWWGKKSWWDTKLGQVLFSQVTSCPQSSFGTYEEFNISMKHPYWSTGWWYSAGERWDWLNLERGGVILILVGDESAMNVEVLSQHSRLAFLSVGNGIKDVKELEPGESETGTMR